MACQSTCVDASGDVQIANNNKFIYYFDKFVFGFWIEVFEKKKKINFLFFSFFVFNFNSIRLIQMVGLTAWSFKVIKYRSQYMRTRLLVHIVDIRIRANRQTLNGYRGNQRKWARWLQTPHGPSVNMQHYQQSSVLACDAQINKNKNSTKIYGIVVTVAKRWFQVPKLNTDRCALSRT